MQYCKGIHDCKNVKCYSQFSFLCIERKMLRSGRHIQFSFTKPIFSMPYVEQELYRKSLIFIRTLFYFHWAELCIYRNIAWVRDKRVITIITFLTLQTCIKFLNSLHF